MKKTKSKILSLLLVIATIFTMVPTALAANDSNISLTVGESTVLRATNYDAALDTHPLLVYAFDQIKWQSSDPTVVAVKGSTPTASITGLKAGYATVIAYYSDANFGSFYQTWSVTVTGTGSIIIPGTTPDTSTPNTPSGYVTSLSQGRISLEAGKNTTLSVTPYDSKYANLLDIKSVEWGSSNTAVATVSGYGASASVYAIAAGEAVIYANVKGEYYSNGVLYSFNDTLGCVVTVTNYNSNPGTGNATDSTTGQFYISPTSVELDLNGGQEVLKAIPFPGNYALNLEKLTWYSSNPNVVAVSSYYSTSGNNYGYGSSAYIRPVSAGTATITAWLDYNCYATCEVTVGSTITSTVKFHGKINSSIDFSITDFQANKDLLYTSYITFGVPTSGALYKNYGSNVMTRIATGDMFTIYNTGSKQLPSVDDITFVPATNFTGVVEIPFTAYDLLGNTSKGTVKIFLAKAFSDVATTNWAYKYVTELTAQGIVNGMTATTFAPSMDLKYGEALKLIMEATGYSSKISTTGHWASGYLADAYRFGLVTNRNIDLERKIDRNAVAELAARALGLSKTYTINAGITKPSDSSNGYVYALYNAGIVNGENINGKNYYHGSDTLTRAEVCAIVCRISDYNK